MGKADVFHAWYHVYVSRNHHRNYDNSYRLQHSQTIIPRWQMLSSMLSSPFWLPTTRLASLFFHLDLTSAVNYLLPATTFGGTNSTIPRALGVCDHILFWIIHVKCADALLSAVWQLHARCSGRCPPQKLKVSSSPNSLRTMQTHMLALWLQKLKTRHLVGVIHNLVDLSDLSHSSLTKAFDIGHCPDS